VASGFGPAIKVIAGAALLIAIVIIGAALWIRRVRLAE
jgi:hypothetical protein